MLAFQKNVFSITTEGTKDVVKAAEKKRRTRALIEEFRKTGDETHKRRLPSVCYMATFEESVNNKGVSGCWRVQEKAHLTGLVVSDFDHVEESSQELFAGWQQRLDFKKEGILKVFVTPSGKGLKVVSKWRKEWGNLVENQRQIAALLDMERYFDESGKDASRAAFVPMASEVLYENDEIYTYHDPECDALLGEAYRRGESGTARKVAAPSPQASTESTVKNTGTYHGKDFEKEIVPCLDKAIGTVKDGDHHETLISKVVPAIALISENNPQLTLERVRMLEMVRTWSNQAADEVENVVSHVCQKPRLTKKPAWLVKALTEARALDGMERQGDPQADLPFEEWANEIEAMWDEFPCLKEICQQHPRRLWPFLLFASAAFLGTDMTLCYYHFYDAPEEKRRLNYNVNGIGDPASGKRALTRIYRLLTEPIKQADQVANDAINQWKEDTGAKASNKEKQHKPKVIKRIHGARTSNTVFITDMNNAVVEVDGELMHQHMLTVDTELDNTLTTQKGGSWIDKQVMELKGFHNEEDSQDYANIDSVSGPFDVYWNIVCTGTPWALSKKVNERNFATGLATRLAAIPVPGTGFQMMPLNRRSPEASEADQALREWAYRLDKRHGELPLWPLVEHCWHWTDQHMAIAGFNQDKAEEMLIKRVSYYGINVSAPFVDMRHWEEREKTGSYEIDDTDRRLCSLALDIQYRCQMHYFGEYARKYFDDQLRDAAANSRRRTNKFSECFRQLPEEFSTEQFSQIFGYANNRSAQKTLQRLIDDKALERTKRGNYRKLMSELIC